ncbi:uncharacterized protein AAGF69_012040 [Amazona ochrocephala]
MRRDMGTCQCAAQAGSSWGCRPEIAPWGAQSAARGVNSHDSPAAEGALVHADTGCGLSWLLQIPSLSSWLHPPLYTGIILTPAAPCRVLASWTRTVTVELCGGLPPPSQTSTAPTPDKYTQTILLRQLLKRNENITGAPAQLRRRRRPQPRLRPCRGASGSGAVPATPRYPGSHRQLPSPPDRSEGAGILQGSKEMAERDPMEGDEPLTRGAVVRTRVASCCKPPGGEASGSSEESDDELEPDSHAPWQGKCFSCIGEDLPQVMPEIIQKALRHRTVYQAHLPGAGVFQCSITGLGFKVKSAVTITYRYTTWSRRLSKASEEMWVPAGPLFDIKVQPRVVQKIYLPHFICLAEDVDTSQCFIAHFKSGAMMLERPTRMVAFSAVLRNPSFSLLGVLWRKLCSALHSFPVHSLVLIYQQLRAADTTFHLYLIPDDNSLKQAVENQEKDWNSRLIPKPPPFSPLFFGCIYQLTSTDLVVITPSSRLPFCYKSPKKQQVFVEIYIKNMAEEIGLLMTHRSDNTEVWRALLRSGEHDSTISLSLLLATVSVEG